MNQTKSQQIVNSINLVLQIPEGNALVQLIGHGNENSNHEALGNWVEEQSDLLSITKPNVMIEQLVHRLNHTLVDINSSIYD